MSLLNFIVCCAIGGGMAILCAWWLNRHWKRSFTKRFRAACLYAEEQRLLVLKPLYLLLESNPSASDIELKNAYRRVVRKLHPDHTGGDPAKTERLKKVNEAYALLSEMRQL